MSSTAPTSSPAVDAANIDTAVSYSEAYCRDAVRAAAAGKEAQLIASIELMKEALLGQLRARAAAIEAALDARCGGGSSSAIANETAKKDEGSSPALVAGEVETVNNDGRSISHTEMVHWLIPFADLANKAATKVGNAYMSRGLLFEVCNVVAAHCQAYFTPSDTTAEAKEAMAQRYRAAKTKFDLICNYSKRATEAIPNTGTFYDEDLCVYLMSKTFKKSATDAYESFFCLGRWAAGAVGSEAAGEKEEATAATVSSGSSCSEIVNFLRSTPEVRLGSIGGGPSSDMTGMIAYFHDLLLSTAAANANANTKEEAEEGKRTAEKVPTFSCQVFDIMDVNWCRASRTPIMAGYTKFLTPTTTATNNTTTAAAIANISLFAERAEDAIATTSGPSPSPSSALAVQYKHIDLKEPYTVTPLLEDLSRLHFISVCWAMNEATFMPEFWRPVLAATRGAYLMVVEGKEDKLDLLVAVCSEEGAAHQRSFIYDRFESPRRLVIKPVAGYVAE